MELQWLARSALTTTTTTTLARVFRGARSPALAPLSLHRQLSTSPMRFAPPPLPSSHAPPASNRAAWPPKRAPSTTTAQTTPATSSSPTPSTAVSDPLKDMYSSENPAQWAMWSSDDFQKRHLGDSSSSAGLTSSSSRTSPGGGTRITLRPITGRTVYVGGHVDPARAFLFVNVMCTRNRVAADFQRQKFHERPGLKKKRLRSQSWRRKFRRGMMAAVERVKELSKQGW